MVFPLDVSRVMVAIGESRAGSKSRQMEVTQEMALQEMGLFTSDPAPSVSSELTLVPYAGTTRIRFNGIRYCDLSLERHPDKMFSHCTRWRAAFQWPASIASPHPAPASTSEITATSSGTRQTASISHTISTSANRAGDNTTGLQTAL